MCARAIASNAPVLGELVPIVKTLYGGNDPNDPYGFSKVRIYPPTTVRVEGIRAKTHRDPETTELVSTVLVRLVDIKTGEEYPEVKMGSLLHAGGLVEEDDLEGKGFFLPSDLCSAPKECEQPILASNETLLALRERLAAEEARRAELGRVTKLDSVGEVFELERHLTTREAGELAKAGARVKVLEVPRQGHLTLEIEGLPFPCIVRMGDLYKAVAPAG